MHIIVNTINSADWISFPGFSHWPRSDWWINYYPIRTEPIIMPLYLGEGWDWNNRKRSTNCETVGLFPRFHSSRALWSLSSRTAINISKHHRNNIFTQDLKSISIAPSWQLKKTLPSHHYPVNINRRISQPVWYSQCGFLSIGGVDRIWNHRIQTPPWNCCHQPIWRMETDKCVNKSRHGSININTIKHCHIIALWSAVPVSIMQLLMLLK